MNKFLNNDNEENKKIEREIEREIERKITETNTFNSYRFDPEKVNYSL